MFAVLAIAFFIGTVIDWVGGRQSYGPSLTLSATFTVLTMYQLFRGALEFGGPRDGAPGGGFPRT